MNFTFEKEKVSCYCNDKSDSNASYTGLISTQSAREKYQNFHQKQPIDQQLKDKKVSLKLKKPMNKTTDDFKTQESSKGGVVPSLKYSDTIKSKNTSINSSKSARNSETESRSWMEKMKSGIQIQSIGRVQTKHIYHQKEEFPSKPQPQQSNSSTNQPRNNPSTKQQQFKKYQIYYPETYLPKQNLNVFDEVSFSTKIEQPKQQKFLPVQPISPDSGQLFEEKETKKLPQKSKLVPKEIESVIDENQLEQDNMSEVLGHGWNEFNYEKEDIYLPTKTILTMATNDRNSQIKNSLNSRAHEMNRN